MNAELLRHAGELEALSAEWNALLERSAGSTVFLSWQWCRAWLQTLGRDVEPFAVAVRDDRGQLRGLAPLYRCPARLLRFIPYRCLCVLGDRSSGSEYPDLLVDPTTATQTEATIADCLWRHAADWDCLWAPRLAGWTGALTRWQRCCGPECTIQTRRRVFSAVPLPASPGEYWQALSANMRSALRRQRKQIDRRCRFKILTSGAEISELLDVFVNLHRRRWASVGDAGAFGRTPGLRGFYAALCREMQGAGWLRMFLLELGGQPLALQFGLIYRGVYHQLQEGFNPDATPGIGNVLRAESIEACIREGLTSYDFLGGFTEHKRRWGAVTRPGDDLFVHRRSFRTMPLRARELWPTGRFMWLPDRSGVAASCSTPEPHLLKARFCSP